MYNFKTAAKIYCIIITLLPVYFNTIYGEEPAALKFSGERLFKHISHIASKETDGRLMGSAGSHKAGRYIEDIYAEYGLMPIGKYSGYSQSFEINARHLGSGNRLSIGNKIFEIKKGFMPLYFSAEGEASGEAFYAGHGLKIEDFKGSNGKIAVALDNGAAEGEDGNALIMKIGELAQESGAKGLVILVRSMELLYNDMSMFPEFIHPKYLKRWQSQHPSMSNTLLEIKTTSAAARLKTPAIKIPVVMAAAGEDEVIAGIAIGIKVKFEDRLIAGKNIMGLIKGTGDEAVIIGAHYDHLGRDGDGNIFYGADDNGTGVAAMLEMASAFSKIKDRLKRSILFIAFDGEEWGLRGASAYIDNPVFPYEKTIAMLNMDSIGRNKPDEIYLLGSLSSPDLKRLNDSVKSRGLNILDTIEFAFDHGSDHYPFYEKGIPSIDYTSSYHEDFHKVTDTVDKVNIEKVSKAAESIFRVAYEIASTDIKFDKPKKVYVPFPKRQ